MFTDILYWRYATKKFDTTKKVGEKDLDQLLESLRLSPSSFGLQPWKFIVVTDKKLRQQVRLVSWNQSQVTDASHLIVLCARKTIDAKYVDSYIALMKKERKMSAVKAFAYATYLKTSVSTKKPEEQRTWASKQVYIALGFLLYTAALLQIDSCPMEGFDSKKCDNILGLNDTDYRSVVFCPIGYRAKDDKYATEKKVRWAKEEVIVT